jgi:uncharacterized protein
MERKTLALEFTEIKLSGSDSNKFAGYASKFNGVDSYGDTIAPGAFAKTLKDRKDNGRQVKMFFNHRGWDMPIGKWLKADEDEKGLFVEGELTPKNSVAENVLASMKHGTLDGLSIGFRLSKDDYEIVGNGERRLIKNITDLVEISVVTFPADDAARVDLDSIKSGLDDIESIRDLERFLRDAGGFSKGAAAALVARATKLLRSESGGGEEAKTAQQLLQTLEGFKLPPKLFT